MKYELLPEPDDSMSQKECDARNLENYKRKLLNMLAEGAVITKFGFQQFADDPRFAPYRDKHEQIITDHRSELQRQIDKLQQQLAADRQA